MSNDNKSPSKDELIQKIIAHSKELSKIDFDQLERDGIISKVRGGYLVNKYSQLPEGARYLIKSMKQNKNDVRIIIFKPPQSFLDIAKKFYK